MSEQPTTGGRFFRDPKTGALRAAEPHEDGAEMPDAAVEKSAGERGAGEDRAAKAGKSGEKS